MADVNSFLKLIRMLESSGGRNTAHRTMASGMHAGDTAVGAAGLMPRTALDMANRRIRDNRADVSDELVANSPSDVIQQMITNNDELRQRYVEDMANLVMNKAKGDPALAATAWLHGHNNPYSKLKEKLASSPVYQERINRAIEDLHLQSNKPTFDVKSLEEALTKEPTVKPYSKISRALGPK